MRRRHGCTRWDGSRIEVADTPGLVVARTLAMLINEAADAVQQGVCTPEGADAAMKLGVNYPAGPFEWLERLGCAPGGRRRRGAGSRYRGERYRVSPWLQARAGARATAANALLSRTIVRSRANVASSACSLVSRVRSALP